VGFLDFPNLSKKPLKATRYEKGAVPRGGSTALKENKDLEKKWDNFFP
jgi:hypothetical protein